MRVVLSRLRGVWPVTGRAVRRSEKDECVKVTAKNLTTSDTIVLGVLITSLLVLSQGMPIEFGSPKENDK